MLGPSGCAPERALLFKRLALGGLGGDAELLRRMLSCRACHATSGDDMRYCGTCGEPLSDEVPARARARESRVLPAGTVVGSYKLLEVLGEGGMGRVYLAEHTRLGRRVALKMLRSKFSSNPESIKRFFGEARAVNKIAHENIVEVTDFVTEEDGNSYYIMELLKGKSLYDQLKADGLMPLERSLSIAIQVANALGAVHEAGIVHRDLKPENIFLALKGTRKDVVKLLDFGIAKLMEPDQGVSIQQTGVGMILGTPTYMSPEQAGGRTIDSRSDIYSLGVILFELTTGEVPFSAETYAEILVQHITQEPRRPSAIDSARHAMPAALESLILDCLRKDASERPQTMSEIEDRLRAVLEDSARAAPNRTVMGTGPMAQASRPSHATPSGRAITPPPVAKATPAVTPPTVQVPELVARPPVETPRSRRPLLALVVVLALLGFAAGAAVLLMNRDDGEDKTAAEPAPAVAATDESVALHVDSTPAGADVVRVDSGETLGKTPLDTRVKRSSAPVRFELRKDGFTTAVQEARLDHDATLSVGLAPAPAPAVAPPETAAPPEATATAEKPTAPSHKKPPRSTKGHRKSDHTLEKGGVIDFE
jgi:serine/threonine-protein kinase